MADIEHCSIDSSLKRSNSALQKFSLEGSDSNRSFGVMMTSTQLVIILYVAATLWTRTEGVACNLCICLENSPTENCVHGFCYLYRSTPYCNCLGTGFMGNRCHLPVLAQTNSKNYRSLHDKDFAC
ncbi:uncharacterized protein LOC110979839 [Acanthaster planci]|uniref:Uncharacterized protein LOC110979839 n=1 Tax=Acanthaster planci TaxID=133434 RepID=A0A8B7YGW1_ACAPL|nr:uncharacterized protein LOC110979839 [Acanthaster planci]